MNLRIVRKSAWVRDPSEPLLIGGGPPKMVLQKTDTLQHEDSEGNWQNVEIVELPIPEHPHELRRKEQREFRQESMAEVRALMNKAISEGTKDAQKD